MSAVAQRAIHGDFTGLRGQHGEDFRNHDGAMAPGWSFASSNHFGYRLRVLTVLFVFFFKPARIFSPIARAAFVWNTRDIGGGCLFFGHKAKY